MKIIHLRPIHKYSTIPYLPIQSYPILSPLYPQYPYLPPSTHPIYHQYLLTTLLYLHINHIHLQYISRHYPIPINIRDVITYQTHRLWYYLPHLLRYKSIHTRLCPISYIYVIICLRFYPHQPLQCPLITYIPYIRLYPTITQCIHIYTTYYIIRRL